MTPGEKPIKVAVLKSKNRFGSQPASNYICSGGGIDLRATRKRQESINSSCRLTNQLSFPLELVEGYQTGQRKSSLSEYPPPTVADVRFRCPKSPARMLGATEVTALSSRLPIVDPLQINASILSSTLSDVMRYQSAFNKLDLQRLQDQHYHQTQDAINQKAVASRLIISEKENSPAKQR